MGDITKRTTELIEEINGICRDNGISCYPDPDEFGKVCMTATDLCRFMHVFEEEKKSGKLPGRRFLEHMGNSPDFPGLYANYVDEDTTCYDRKRLACEQHLGIFVQINIIRPEGRLAGMNRTLEQEWTRMCFGLDMGKGRLCPRARKKITHLVDSKGKGAAAAQLFESLLGKYGKGPKDKSAGCWIKKGNAVGVKRYTKDPFKGETPEPSEPANGMDFFADADMPYSELHLEDFREEISSMNSRFMRVESRTAGLKKEREKHFDMLRSAHRKYHAAMKDGVSPAEPIDIYDYNGNFIRTIPGRDGNGGDLG